MGKLPPTIACPRMAVWKGGFIFQLCLSETTIFPSLSLSSLQHENALQKKGPEDDSPVFQQDFKIYVYSFLLQLYKEFMNQCLMILNQCLMSQEKCVALGG